MEPTIAMPSDNSTNKLDDDNIIIFMTALELTDYFNEKRRKFPM